MASVRQGLDKRLARLPQVLAELDQVAAEVLDTAKARAIAHRDTGRLANSLKVKRGRVDRRVESDDPNILSIEYGHTDPKTGKHVAGLHILSGAAADVASRK
jgi:uncharacterized protein DUF5403